MLETQEQHHPTEGSEVIMMSDQMTANSSYSASALEIQASHEPTFRQGLLALAKSSWINMLVVFIPFGIASHFVWNSTVTFVLNFIAIIPLAKLLGFATEDIALRTGEVIGGLLNASFGNAVELIVSIIALSQNLVVVVQASMLGSILSNLLLVLGMCFWFGGYKYQEQSFNTIVAQTSASLLFIATISLLLPAAFYASVGKAETSDELKDDILNISRATSVILLIIYFAFLFFQLKTHKEMFLQSPSEAKRTSYQVRRTSTSNNLERMLYQQKKQQNHAEEEEEIPQMPFWLACISLLVVTALVAVCAEFLVSAIEDVVEQWHISETFVGLILLPIVGNAAEHVTAVTVAIKNKMDLALGVAVGSSMQIALLITPLMVIIGWGMNVEMSLLFNVFETAVMLISVVMVNYLMMDGKSNWLEGFMLIMLYIVLAICFFYYPDAAASELGK
ncbi:calcium/proton exchanger [Dichotomocladium elegans]|nr:calcium/proton exchanger [Dichotomocladium elegans]